MKVVGIFQMRHKQSQQRGRTDGTVTTVADRSAVEENCALAPQTTQAPQGWSPVGRQPPCVGRDFVDSKKERQMFSQTLRSGARWQDLPEKYPHPSTCWRRLRDWEEQDRRAYIVSTRCQPTAHTKEKDSDRIDTLFIRVILISLVRTTGRNYRLHTDLRTVLCGLR